MFGRVPVCRLTAVMGMAGHTVHVASLSRLPSGSWRVAVKHAGERRTGTAPTRREAVALGARLVDEIEATTGPGRRRRNTRSLTVGALIDRVVDQAVDPKGRPWSATYRAQIGYAVDAIPADVRAWLLGDVTTADVDGLYHRLGLDYPASRVRRVHRLLSVAWRWGRRWGWVTSSPVDAATPPPEPERSVSVPAVADVARIATTIDDPMLAACVRLAMASGARRGELCGLQWGDVDLKARTVVFRRSVAYTPAAGLIVKGIKTGERGVRAVALDVATVEMLRRWRKEQATRHTDMVRPAAFVFGVVDRPRRPDWVSKAWRDVADAAGSDVTFHELRHLSASLLLGAGVDVVTVAGRLGHSSPRTTLTVYAHQLPERDRDAADVIGRQLRK